MNAYQVFHCFKHPSLNIEPGLLVGLCKGISLRSYMCQLYGYVDLGCMKQSFWNLNFVGNTLHFTTKPSAGL